MHLFVSQETGNNSPPFWIMLWALLLSVLVSGVYWLLAENAFLGREKASPFECGFDPEKSARLPFSYRFFLLAILFVVFDVEIALLFPFVSGESSLGVGWAVTLFLWILTLGLLHEWRMGMLDWVH